MSRRTPITLNQAWFADATERKLWSFIRAVFGALAVVPMVALFWSGLS